MSALEEIDVDIFAGGGGASTGMEAASEKPVDVAINHNALALKVHAANHPHTEHFAQDVWDRRVHPLAITRGRKVRRLWMSPDCTHFSRAKGGKPLKQKIRSLAWVGIKWAKFARPDVIFLENVPEFPEWGPLGRDNRPIVSRKGETFRRWKRSLERLGYVVDHRVLDSSQYGAPTKRRRFFLVARCDGQPIRWPEPTHGPGLKPFRTAAECIDWSIRVPSIFDRKRPLAAKTLARIAEGIRRFVLDTPNPYVVEIDGAEAVPVLIQTGYGERKGQAPRVLDIHQPHGTVVAGGVKTALVAAFLTKHYGGVYGQRLDQPTSTITAVDHHALTTVTVGPRNSGNAQKVRAFLTAFYGSEEAGQSLNDPMRTVTTKDRFGLVTVSGDREITDIGMRMLDWSELLRAQFGRFADGYDMRPAKTKTAKVRLIGNSVPPEVVEALVRVNTPRALAEAA